MSRSTARVVLSGAVIAALALPAPAQPRGSGETDLEQILAASADSAAEHRALASHYRAQAARARAKARSHRWMADHYGGSLAPAIAAEQRRHCAHLATVYDAQAGTFDRLADGHAEAAAAE
jgi:hypothetical protein